MVAAVALRQTYPRRTIQRPNSATLEFLLSPRNNSKNPVFEPTKAMQCPLPEGRPIIQKEGNYKE